MVSVTFLKDCLVNGAGGEAFKAGNTHELSEASAQHWIARGKAVIAETTGNSSKVSVAASVTESSGEAAAAEALSEYATETATDTSVTTQSAEAEEATAGGITNKKKSKKSS